MSVTSVKVTYFSSCIRLSGQHDFIIAHFTEDHFLKPLPSLCQTFPIDF